MKKRVLALAIALVMIISCIPTVFAASAPAISAANLSYEDSVYIWFAVDASIANTEVLVWTAPQETYAKGTEAAVLTPSSTMKNGKTTFNVFRYNKLTLKQMTDTIYACAYNGTCGKVVKYSAIEYAVNTLAKTTDETVIETLNAMLAFGGAIQKQFNYATDRLASDEYCKVTLDGTTFADGFTKEIVKKGTQITLAADVADGFAVWQTADGWNLSNDANATITVDKTMAISAVYGNPADYPLDADLEFVPGDNASPQFKLVNFAGTLGGAVNDAVNVVSGTLDYTGMIQSSMMKHVGNVIYQWHGYLPADGHYYDFQNCVLDAGGVKFRVNARFDYSDALGTWVKYVPPVNVTLTLADAIGANLSLVSSENDPIPAGTYTGAVWAEGGISIDSGAAQKIGFTKNSATEYTFDMSSVAPVAGNVAEINGMLNVGTGNVSVNAAFLYSGAQWVPVVVVDATVDTSRTGENMLFMLTTASLPESSYNGYAWFADRWNTDYGFKYNGVGTAVQFFHTSGIIYTCSDFNSARSEGDYVDIHGVTSFNGVYVYFRPAHFIWDADLNRWA